MKKILFLSNTANFSKFNIPYMRWFKEQGWQVDYCSAGEELVPDCDNQYSINIARSPFSLKNVKAYFELKKILKENEYDILHCHTPMGGFLGRLAACSLHKKHKIKVIYTAHGFHFYKGAPLFNWLAYYPVERILAHKTDVLITINSEDYERAKTFKAGKIFYVPGVGVDINKFRIFNKDKVSDLRLEFGIPNEAKVLLSVGEVNKNKNHKIVIEALPDMPDFWYIICGKGPLVERYKKLAEGLGVADRLIMAGYRENIADFCNMADIFVFPSLREGLGLALIEAMAAGLPCIAVKNRGTKDSLGEDSQLFFDANSVKDLSEKIKKVLNGSVDEIQRNNLRLQKYNITNTLQIMQQIYMNEMSD